MQQSRFSNRENAMLKFTIHTHTHQNHHRINMHLLYQSIVSNTEMKLKQIKTLKELRITHRICRAHNATPTTLIESVWQKYCYCQHIYIRQSSARLQHSCREKMPKTPSEKLHEFIHMYARLTWPNQCSAVRYKRKCLRVRYNTDNHNIVRNEQATVKAYKSNAKWFNLVIIPICIK